MGGREAWGEGRVHSAWAGQQSQEVTVCEAAEQAQNEGAALKSRTLRGKRCARHSSAVMSLFQCLRKITTHKTWEDLGESSAPII